VKRLPYLRSTVRRPGGALGLAIIMAVLGVAYFGRFLAANEPTAIQSAPGSLPGLGLPLGTDYLGRDVLSRVLNGGASAITMAIVATAGAYILGLLFGIISGYFGGTIDMVLMRGIDIILAFPPLMVMLLLVGGLSNHIWVLILGVILVQLPSIARIARATAEALRFTEFVDAAKARGDGLVTIWKRDMLANISSIVLADFGIRFGISIILIASMNFLGLGLAPPASDWGLMISENRNLISLNPWSLLAPAVMLALTTIGLNLFADAYLRCVNAGSSSFQRDVGVAEAAAALAPEPPIKHVRGVR
jgi:peptide/nickel transport system permease protein